MRPLCKCKRKPCAINYIKNGKTFYRRLCHTCMHKGLRHGIPKWEQSGYTKKSSCDKCGFKCNCTEVFDVYHVDGNLNNCRPTNLKTICANCQRLLYREGISWRQGDLTPDV